MNTYDELKLENQLCFSVYATSRAITKLYRPFLEEIDLTYPQYLAMLVLWENKTITLKDLGAKLYLDSGTLTPLVKRLESMGLVKRQRSIEDERLLCVTLTETGEALIEKAKTVPGCILKGIDLDIQSLIAIKADIDTLLNSIKPNET
jgi:DNA-binding MarR family transcriptional regulator